MNPSIMYDPNLEYATGTIRGINAETPLLEGWLWCDGTVYQCEDYLELSQAIFSSLGGHTPSQFPVPAIPPWMEASIGSKMARCIIKT